jgi:hypothetical protein
MTKPTIPQFTFKTPFAEQGDKATIKDDPWLSGRTSLKDGFPVETQLPMNQGGIAPNRTDFNYMFYILSAFAFWQQSGGLYKWRNTLDYTKPSVVFHANNLWWCVADNGPDSGGIVEPGTNEAVWIHLLLAMADMIAGGDGSGSASGGGGGGGGSDALAEVFGGNVTGTIIAYYGTSAPNGYLKCDGSSFSPSVYPKLYQVLGKSTLPDLRGCFLRGLGGTAGALGTKQEDAGRNATGDFIADNSQVGVEGVPPGGSCHGIFAPGEFVNNYDLQGGYGFEPRIGGYLTIDLSRSWGTEHTANEFRPVNMGVLYCIKHD